MDDSPRYLMYPIKFNLNFLTDYKRAIREIIEYGLYRYSTILDGSTELDSFQQALRHFDLDTDKAAAQLPAFKKWYYVNSDEKVLASVNWDIIWDYYKNEKTDFEVASFLGYASLKSIIGPKPFIKTTNEFFVARFYGYASTGQVLEDHKQMQLYKKWSSRYALDKIKEELKMNWGLKIYARYTRGFYASFKIDYEDLVFRAELNRKSFKAKQKKKEENDVLARVKAKLEAIS